MLDAESAAQLWLERHEPEEWQQLLADCCKRPALSEDVLHWLAGHRRSCECNWTI